MTYEIPKLGIFVVQMAQKDIDTLYILAFTHRNLDVSEVGKLHIEPDNQKERLSAIKDAFNLSELMFLSTCNRVEFIIKSEQAVDSDFLSKFFAQLYPNIEASLQCKFAENAMLFNGFDAVQHILSVASSVDSMVVGEREIITQVRSAYEFCRKNGLTDDLIRIIMRHTIETAKRVYTETHISRHPVSVVSLAYHRLRDMNVPLDSRILVIGAGVTNTNMGKFLSKHGFTNFHVFNRTFEKAVTLANDLKGVPHELSELKTFKEGFDIIITCTGSEEHIISPELYTSLLNGEKDRKVVIDIAIPQDLSPVISENHPVTHISVDLLQKISNENLKHRSKEIQHVEEIIAEALYEFKHIYQVRSIELAMRDVPQKVKEIKATALNEVFRNDLNELDESSREVVEKIIGYMEKKYMSMPMIMAKEILLKKHS